MSALIVGSGSIAVRHARVLRSLGVQSLHHFSRGGRELAVEGNPAVKIDNLTDISQEFDLVVICSKTQDHVNDLLEIADKSAVVLLEKPVSGSIEQLDRLRDELRNPNVYVSFPLRFTKSFWDFKSTLSRHINAPLQIYAESRSWLPDWRPSRNHRDGYWNEPGSGGVLLELIHEFDYVNYLYGPLQNLRIHDSSRGLLGLSVPESIDATAQNAEGVEVSIHLDFCTKNPSRFASVSVSGTEIRWDLIQNSVSHKPDEGAPSLRDFDDVERDSWFRRQYEELLEPGTHPSRPASLDEARGLTETILRAWETL